MVRYRLEYALTKLIGWIAQILPIRLAMALGDSIGDLFFYVIRIRKKVALDNLQQAFGHEMSAGELKTILHRNYRHFGRMLLEFARLPRLNREMIIRLVPVENSAYLQELMARQRGLLVLSGHFGNWEYLAARLANLGPALHCVFKEQKNKSVDRLIKEVRLNLGMVPLKVKGGAAKGVLMALREKGLVLIVMDQDAGRKGEFLPFLGRPASTNRGPALIAIKHRVPVVMAFAVRQPDGSLTVRLEKFPEINDFPDDETGVTQFLAAYNRILEQYIRQYPEQWFWMHRRWKTKPGNPDEKSVATL